MEGINDIGQARENPTPSADEVIGAHKQIIERAHARGLKIFGATLTPFYGAAYYTEVGEAKRQAVNDWIRTSKAYDGVIDFDKATRDPNDPEEAPGAVRFLRSPAPERCRLQGDGGGIRPCPVEAWSGHVRHDRQPWQIGGRPDVGQRADHFAKDRLC